MVKFWGSMKDPQHPYELIDYPNGMCPKCGSRHLVFVQDSNDIIDGFCTYCFGTLHFENEDEYNSFCHTAQDMLGRAKEQASNLLSRRTINVDIPEEFLHRLW